MISQERVISNALLKYKTPLLRTRLSSPQGLPFYPCTLVAYTLDPGSSDEDFAGGFDEKLEDSHV